MVKIRRFKNFMGLLLMGILLNLSMAAWADSPSIASILQRAATLSHEGRYGEAARLYRRASEMRPEDMDILKDLLWASWYAGQYEETIHTAGRLLKRDKDRVEIMNLMALAQINAGHKEDAFKTFQRSLSISDRQVPIRRAIGRLYESFRDYDHAAETYQGLIREKPDDPMLHMALGKCYFYQDKFRDAADSLSKAVRLEPKNQSYKLLYAKALYYGGRLDESTATLKELVEQEPTSWQAVNFLVDVASVTGNMAMGMDVMERKLRNYDPKNEGKMLQLADLYLDFGAFDRHLATLDRLLSHNPNSGEALTAKAAFLLEHGKPLESVEYYEKLTKGNPESIEAWTGMANALFASSQTARALTAIEQARKLDPTDPELALEQSSFLYDAGNHSAARQLLLDWLSKNDEGEGVLPILLYHGLTPIKNDPILSATIHVTTNAFESHIQALKEAGYVPITAAQAAEWFHKRLKLPKNAVLISFDDARLDSFRHADPILKKYKFKATMFAPLSNVDADIPGFANWKDLAFYESTGRWETQAHGDLGHKFITTDEAGRTALFLTNKQWLDKEKRLETTDEWEARVRADHESSKNKIQKNLGHTPEVFAFPEGDYGQVGIPNFKESGRRNLKICREHYAVCFIQNKHGINFRSRDVSMAFRVEPRENWTPERLVKLLRDENPVVLMRRTLLARAVWEVKIKEATHWLAETKKTKVSKSIAFADEGRIWFAAGDESRGVMLAKEAMAAEKSTENKQLLEEMRRKALLDITPGVSFFSDSKTRQNLVFDNSLGGVAAFGSLFRFAQIHGTYREQKAPVIEDNGGRIEMYRRLGLYNEITVQAQQHLYSGNVINTYSALGELRTRWTDSLDTDFRGGRSPYDTALALDDNVAQQYAELDATLALEGLFKTRLQGRFADLTDSNQRYDFLARLSRPVVSGSNLSFVYEFSEATTDRVSPNYYSPQHLVMNAVGLQYVGLLRRGLWLDASYLPGYGSENKVKDTFIQVADITAEIYLGERFTARPSFAISRTPSYDFETYNFSFTWRF